MPDEFVLDQKQIERIIIPGAFDKALLLGLLNPSLQSYTYAVESYGIYCLRVVRRILPNAHSRLDILLVNSTPVGTIVSSELSKNLYHMVGMFMDEAFRSSRIDSTLPNYNDIKKQKADSGLSPAGYLLQSYLRDVMSHGRQVSLEVLNNNEVAWRLYEKELSIDEGSQRKRGFEILGRSEIEIYGKLRGKTVGKWHPLDYAGKLNKYGIQWNHVPDYGGTSKWSINRVYLIKPIGHDSLLTSRSSSRIFSIFRTALTIIKYGAPTTYLIQNIKKAWRQRGH